MIRIIPDLLELINLDETIKLDIRYARNDNFVGRPVYQEARAFLQPVAVEALARVNSKLRSKGLGLIVFDGYRSWPVTNLFWDVVTKEQRPYVADPAVGSRHNRGCAINLSLYELSTGRQLEMPSEFDEFNEKSHPDFDRGAITQRRNRDILINTMESDEFEVNPKEWRHYDHADREQYEILNFPIDEIGG